MKKGQLSEVENACIRGMFEEGVSPSDMAKQLDRSVTAIKKAIGPLQKQKEKAERESYFINKTAGGQEGITVMTQAASVRGDEAKNAAPPAPPAKHRNFIHKIRSDEE